MPAHLDNDPALICVTAGQEQAAPCEVPNEDLAGSQSKGECVYEAKDIRLPGHRLHQTSVSRYKVAGNVHLYNESAVICVTAG